MPGSSRRTLIAWVVFLASGSWLLEFFRRQAEPPPADWVRDALWGDDLLAYAIVNGDPRAVLANQWDAVVYDRMIPGDWFWPMWPPRPQWQLTGAGYAIARSNAPATVGFAPCVGVFGERCQQAPELFGQINDPAVVAMEVLTGGEWQRFAVSAPGFAIQLAGAPGEPDGYRWLDADNRVIWQTASASPKNSKATRKRRRRTRARSTPGPNLGDAAPHATSEQDSDQMINAAGFPRADPP